MPVANAKPSARRGTETRRLSKIVTVRYSPDEHAGIAERASVAGLTLPSFLRELSVAPDKRETRSTRRPSIEKQMVAHLLGQLGRVSGNLHQLVKHLNFGNHPGRDELAEVIESCALLRREIMLALGRKAE